ncbi:MAG TPA: hypothetical protein PKM73_07590 [Verrucomicrobiota bacterium]|nr:hypothetical protein [Verrucomicrobiota bacterium]HNU51250.1 hypothetical protein [Verrucomicrobiota bacterium]
MKRRLSLIPSAWVDAETKALHVGEVGFAQEIETLSDLADLAINFDLAPAVFSDNTRKKSHLESMDWVIYDFDDGTPSARIHEILSGDNCRGWRLNHLVAGSKNHLRDKGDGRGVVERFHIFLPLQTPITDADFYSFLWGEFARLFLRGLTPDPACKDVSRYLAKHSSVLFVEDEGIDVPLEMFRRLQQIRQDAAKQPVPRPQRRAQSEFKGTMGEGSATDRFRRTYAFRLLRDEMSADGQRYAKSATIVGVMIKCGLSADEGLALFDHHAIYGNSFTRKSVERMFRQFGAG